MPNKFVISIVDPSSSVCEGSIDLLNFGLHRSVVLARKVERLQDNLDGRNHPYAPSSNSLIPHDTMFCFSLGGRT
jgi:hypothetical protein